MLRSRNKVEWLCVYGENNVRCRFSAIYQIFNIPRGKPLNSNLLVASGGRWFCHLFWELLRVETASKSSQYAKHDGLLSKYYSPGFISVKEWGVIGILQSYQHLCSELVQDKCTMTLQAILLTSSECYFMGDRGKIVSISRDYVKGTCLKGWLLFHILIMT